MTSAETEPRVWNVTQRLAAIRERARACGRRVIDLGQGAPVDPTPNVIRAALAEAADAPGYPGAHGTSRLRGVYADWAARRLATDVDPEAVLPTLGSKEFIALLPTMLGLCPRDLIVVPQLAYPTYRVGAELAGCQVVASDSVFALGPRRVAAVWINTPSNPTGRVLPPEHLRKVVDWARHRGALVVSDECYIELGSTAGGVPPVSVLNRDVSGRSTDNLLAVHSLSKTYSMAGYRCGFVTGDAGVVERLLRRRRDAGLLVPLPVQAAAIAALSNDGIAVAARARYDNRRRTLSAALREGGFRIDDSEAGLFLWATADEPGEETAARLADAGLVVAPGEFYGPAGRRHVRMALTATDADVDEAAGRLAALP